MSPVEHEARRLLAERDAEILGRDPQPDDLDDLVRWTAENVDLED